MGLEAPFVDSIIVCLPKATLLVISQVFVVADEGLETSLKVSLFGC